jgi:WD40 repeat protein
MARELEMLGAGASIKRLRHLQKRFRMAALLGAAAFGFGLVGLAVKEVHARERANAMRRVAYVTTRGTDYLKEGDYASALPFFLTAAQQDASNAQTHRLRIGATVASAVKPANVWLSPRGAIFSPNGLRHIVAVSNRVEIRDSLTGAMQASFAIGNPKIAKITNDDSVGVASGKDLFLRNWSTGEITRFGTPEIIYNFNFHPAQREVVICSTNATRLLNLETRSIEEIPSTSEDPNVVAIYSTSGDKLILGKASGKAEVWSREPLRKVSAEFKHNMVYAGWLDEHNADRVLTCGFDLGVYWDARSGQPVSARLAHKFGVFCLDISPDRKVLASGGFDRVVRLSDPTSLVPQSQNPVLYHSDWVLSLAFIDNDRLVVHCGDGSNFVWNLKPELTVERINWRDIPNPTSATLRGLSITASGSNVIVNRAGAILSEFRLHSEISTVAIRPNGRQFAVGARDQHGSRYAALLYDVAQPDEPAMRLPHMDGINLVKYSPSGRMIVTCSEDHTAVLWDANTGRPLASPLKHDWQVTWADFNRDETWVATASWDSTVRVWDTRTGEPLTPPFQFPEYLEWVQFDDGDQSLLAANVTAKRLYKIKLPLAELPFEKYRDALPAPDSLVVSPAGF